MCGNIKSVLQPFQSVADLIARTSGAKTEVVLHDLSDPLHSVVYVVNGTVTDRQVGQGFRHLVVEMLRSEASDLLPDWWFRYEKKLIRCTTLLIRNAKGVVVGALCVNTDVTQELSVLEHVKHVLPGLSHVQVTEVATNGSPLWAGQGESMISATLSTKQTSKESVGDAILRLIDQMVLTEKISKESSKERRRSFLQLLDQRGIFLVKGALEHTAERLGVSKVTIYSDLDAIRQ